MTFDSEKFLNFIQLNKYIVSKYIEESEKTLEKKIQIYKN